MAIHNNNNISGAVGPVVFYSYLGKAVMRSRPSRVKQTKAMKKNASEFGLASALSCQVRYGLKDLVPDIKERQLRYGLAHCLKKWLKQESKTEEQPVGFATLEGYELNGQCLLRERLRVFPSVTWNKTRIDIEVPALSPMSDLSVPPGTKSVLFRFRAIYTDMDRQPDLLNLKDVETEVPYKQQSLPAQTLTIPLSRQAKTLCIVFLTLQYKTGSEIIQDEKWRCGAIVGFKKE